jgi:hypothetical protein
MSSSNQAGQEFISNNDPSKLEKRINIQNLNVKPNNINHTSSLSPPGHDRINNNISNNIQNNYNTDNLIGNNISFHGFVT